MTTLQFIFLIIVTSISGIGAASEEFQTHHPIISATLVGIALGDVTTGVMVGAAVELIALGWMTVGAASPPDPALAGTVAAVLAILGHVNVGVAVGIAIPVAVAGQLLQIVQLSTIEVAIVHLGDKFAREGNTRGIGFAHWLTAVPSALRVALPTALVACFASASFAQNMFNGIPKVITGGLQVTAGFLVVVGYAMVLKQINRKDILPFFFIGFLIMTFSHDMTLIALSIVGICFAVIYYLFLDKSAANAGGRKVRSRDGAAAPEASNPEASQSASPAVESTMDDGKKLTKSDLMKVFLRTQFYQVSWTYERFQNLCYCYCMVPILKRLYPEKEELSTALTRHMEYFNTNPIMASPVLGVNAAMEESMVHGSGITEEAITSTKVALMGPFAGIGDSVFWGILRPMFAAIAAGIASQGNLMGPIFFFLAFNIVRVFVRYYGLILPYKQGTNFISMFHGGEQKFVKAISVLAYTVIGGLVARWTTINIPVQLYSFVVSGKTVTTTIQDQLNAIMPNLLPLALTFFVYWLLKKKVKPTYIIFGLMFVGVAGYALGILG